VRYHRHYNMSVTHLLQSFQMV